MPTFQPKAKRTQRIAAEEQDCKQEQRERILEFLQQHRCKGSPRYLTFPGLLWKFEELLLSRVPGATVIGLERNYDVFLDSVENMPGQRKCVFSELAPLEIPAYRTTAGYFLNIEAGDFLTARVHKGLKQLKQIRKALGDVSGVWLDFQCNIQPEIETCLMHLSACLRPSQPVPVVITLQMGREQMVVTRRINASSHYNDPLLRRAAFLENRGLIGALPYHRMVKHIDSWSYRSCNTTMMTWCGIWDAVQRK